MSLFHSNSIIRRTPTTLPSFEGGISLVDSTKPENERGEEPTEEEEEREEEEEEAVELVEDVSPATTNLDGTPISRAATFTRDNRRRIREGIARRKYARYSQERYADDGHGEGGEDFAGTGQDESPLTLHTQPSSSSAQEGELTPITPGPSTKLTRAGTAATTTSTLAHSRTKAKHLRTKAEDKVRKLLPHRKRLSKKKEGQYAIDILHENQRGFWFLGRPYYSSNSLLNFDAAPWTNHLHQPSAVDVTDAQCPDPTWDWSWKTWYVDMSLDVDDQGWQYSFMFQNRFGWHGTHPWFHSFVRRRRWIRKRQRKHWVDPTKRGKELEGGMKDAHKLNEDYFTIHPSYGAGARADDATSYTASTAAATRLTEERNTRNRILPQNEEELAADVGVDTLQSLLKKLKNATVDREKINFVLDFMDQGNDDDVYYLADEMPHILSTLMFQYSQRQLLALMIAKAQTELENGDGEDQYDSTDDADNRESESNSKTELAQGAKVRDKGKGKSPESSASQDSEQRTKQNVTYTTPSQTITSPPPEPSASSPQNKPSVSKTRKQALRKAINVTDAHIRSLEYWSDIKRTVVAGESAFGVTDGVWTSSSSSSDPPQTGPQDRGKEEAEEEKQNKWAGLEATGPAGSLAGSLERAGGSGVRSPAPDDNAPTSAVDNASGNGSKPDGGEGEEGGTEKLEAAPSQPQPQEKDEGKDEGKTPGEETEKDVFVDAPSDEEEIAELIAEEDEHKKEEEDGDVNKTKDREKEKDQD